MTQSNTGQTDRNNAILVHHANGETMARIGEQFGLSGERVRQILAVRNRVGGHRPIIDPIVAMQALRRSTTWKEAADRTGVTAWQLHVFAAKIGVLPAIRRLFRLRRRAQILKALRDVANRIDRPFRGSDFGGSCRLRGTPDPQTLRHHFGSVRGAVRAAGLPADWAKAGYYKRRLTPKNQVEFR